MFCNPSDLARKLRFKASVNTFFLFFVVVVIIVIITIAIITVIFYDDDDEDDDDIPSIGVSYSLAELTEILRIWNT